MIVEVARNLEALQPEQYVLAFVFLGSYALALGHLFDRRGRAICAGVAFVTAVGFIAGCPEWEHGVMVVALALVGMGAFSATAWVFWFAATWHEVRAARAALEPMPPPEPAALPLPARIPGLAERAPAA